MAQGKMKVKAKLPDKSKNKNKAKGKAVTQRANKPIQPKKQKHNESNKLKRMITKTVNKAAETEIRGRVDGLEGSKKNLSKAQEAVVKHHQGTSKT